MKAPGVFVARLIEYDENEAHKMNRLWDEWELRPKPGDGVRLRAPREGVYWQLKDGLIVRVAAGEGVPDVEDATGQ